MEGGDVQAFVREARVSATASRGVHDLGMGIFRVPGGTVGAGWDGCPLPGYEDRVSDR